MPSQLSRQLEYLALSKGFSGSGTGKASLIYSPKHAANISSEEIYRSCLEGFAELCKIDSRFSKFQSSLFGGVPKEREQNTKEEDKTVNANLKQFLRLLTDHFMEACCFKVLEHLIRSFKVHEYNVDDLMDCALPYHETREFQQLTSILRLNRTKWHWLKGVQEVGVALPRSALVSRCLKDLAVLKFIGEMAQWSVAPGFSNQRVLPFYVMVICEVILATPKVTEQMMQCLVQFIVSGLVENTDTCSEFKNATYIIVVSLMKKAQLSTTLLSALLEAIVNSDKKESWHQVMSMVCQLYETQSHYTSMPGRVLKLLLEMDNLGSLLGQLMDNGFNARPMLEVLIGQVFCRANKRHLQLLKSLMCSLPMDKHLLDIVVSAMMDESTKTSDGGSDAEIRLCDEYGEIMRGLDTHFPMLLDQVINENLRPSRKKSKRKRSDGLEEKEAKRKKLMCFFRQCLPGSLLQPISESSDLLLSLAVDAPQAEARKMAMEQLSTLLSKPYVALHTKRFATSAILRRLQDDDFDVVRLAMLCPFDGNDSDLLKYYDSVWDSFARAAMMVWEKVPCEGNALATAMQAVETCKTLCKRIDGKHEEMVGNMLGFVLMPSASGLSWKIMETLSTLPTCFSEFLKLGMKKQKTTASNLIVRLAKSMSSHWLTVVDHLLPQSSDRTQHLILLALVKSCSMAKTESGPTSHTALPVVLKMWKFLEDIPEPYQSSSIRTSGPDMFDEQDLPTPHHLTFCANNLKEAKYDTLVYLLLVCLKSIVGGSCHKQPIETWSMLLRKIIHLGRPKVFLDHVKQVLHVLEHDHNCKWQVLLDVIGSLADGADDVCYGSALNLVAMEIKDTPAGILRDDTIILDLMLQIFTSISSACINVRKDGLDCLQAVSTALANNRDNLSCLCVCLRAFLMQFPSLSTSNLAADPTQMLEVLKDYLRTAEGTKLVAHMSDHLHPHPRVTSIKAVMFLLKSLNGRIRNEELLVKCIPLLSRDPEMGKYTIFSLFRPSCKETASEIVEFVLKLFSKESVSATADTALESLLGLLESSLEKNINEDDAGIGELVARMKSKCCERVSVFFDALKPGTMRTRILDSLLKLYSKSPVIGVKNAARQALELITISPDDFHRHLDCTAVQGAEDYPAMLRLPVLCVSVMEILQWKSNLCFSGDLILHIQGVLLTLLPSIMNNCGNDSEEYVCRLGLSALKCGIQNGDAADVLQHFKVELLLDYLRHAPNVSVRNSALEVLSTAANYFPHQILSYVLEVLQIMGESGILEENAHSRQVAVKALGATVPAWIQCGNSSEQLWNIAMSFMEATQPEHRVTILSSILQAVPQVEGLSSALMVMIKFIVSTPDAKMSWLFETARSLCQTVALSSRAEAFGECIAQMSTENKNLNHSLLLMKLISLEIQSFPFQNMKSDLHCETAAALSKACEVILHAALNNLSALDHVSKSFHSGSKGKHENTSLFKPLIGIVSLLKQMMGSQTFLQVLAEFVKGCSRNVMPHALKLFADKVKEAGLDLAAGEDVGFFDMMATSALGILSSLKITLSDPAVDVVTKQTALSVLQACTMVFGKTHPTHFMDIMECVGLLVQGDILELKGSALATAAALIKGLKQGAVPYLPKVVPSILSATEKTIQCLPDQEFTESTTPNTTEANEKELALLTLTGGLVVIQEIVNNLPEFISPYVCQILATVLDPKVTAIDHMGCGKLALATARRIAESVPPRLLAKPLFGMYEQASKEGEIPLVQLLDLVGVMASKMDAESTVNYHGQVFLFLLEALDIRQRGFLSLAATHSVESACTAAIVQLVMKLSEKQFKPLFMKTIDWSHLKVDPAGREYLGKRVAFFELMGSLVHKLRSVFVNYLGYFLEDAVKALLATGIKKGKRAKIKQEELQEEEIDVHSLYLLRLSIIRTLHRFCAYDMVGFLTPEKLEDLLPAVVQQLKAGEQEESVIQELSFLEKDSEQDKAFEADWLGVSTVSFLVRIAVMSGSQDMWRQVNSSVLKISKKASHHTRILVVEFVWELLTALKEDYLSLVPETLPRLAEFLEDPHTRVSNRARDIIRSLETISGESYDQYLK